MRFEEVRRELIAFSKEREETWKNQGIQNIDRSDRQNARDEVTELSPKQPDGMLDVLDTARDESSLYHKDNP
jgi:hypothetical protein